MFCLLLRFLLAGAVGTHGIANGASVVVTYEKGKTPQNVLKTNALRSNDIKNDLRQQAKTFVSSAHKMSVYSEIFLCYN